MCALRLVNNNCHQEFDLPITFSDLSFLTGQQIRLLIDPSELLDMLSVSIATRVRRAYDGSTSLMSRSLRNNIDVYYVYCHTETFSKKQP